ncbi:hypothetical protein GH714_042590 [Hevea brasiliensis]|uniref:Uncharacterized protein n=1 Tax=Hevea brasiliensis TaxID=3981 RepID=A0A6A6K124_HEVBR|nr:hypothetical protein GH714_042590 [Hevea brasiliensis]
MLYFSSCWGDSRPSLSSNLTPTFISDSVYTPSLAVSLTLYSTCTARKPKTSAFLEIRIWCSSLTAMGPIGDPSSSCSTSTFIFGVRVSISSSPPFCTHALTNSSRPSRCFVALAARVSLATPVLPLADDTLTVGCPLAVSSRAAPAFARSSALLVPCDLSQVFRRAGILH